MGLQTELNSLKHLAIYIYFKRKTEVESEIQKLRTKNHPYKKQKKNVMKFVKLRKETEKKTNSSEK